MIKESLNPKNSFKLTSILLLLTTVFSCDKYDLVRTNPHDLKSKNFIPLPTLTTSDATAISSNSANTGGNVIFDGGTVVLVRGVCWDTNFNPTLLLNTKTQDGTGTGTFISTITGLKPNTTYYVRAFATNNIGTAYGTECNFSTLSVINDIEGNVYNTVAIGKQIWMKENLKITKFNDGEFISLDTWNTKITTPAYGWQANDISNGEIYGALYNWYAVNTNKLCPTGWHVPTDNEWKQLEIYLGMGNGSADVEGLRGTNEGGKMKETGTIHWIAPNFGATNESGFTALPGGSGSGYSGGESDFGVAGYWWTSTTGPTYAIYRALSNGYASIWRSDEWKNTGFSIRCVKN